MYDCQWVTSLLKTFGHIIPEIFPIRVFKRFLLRDADIVFSRRDVNSDSAIRSSSHDATFPARHTARQGTWICFNRAKCVFERVQSRISARVQPQLIDGHEKTLSPHKDTNVVLDKSTCATPLHSWSPGRPNPSDKLNNSQLFWVVTFIRMTDPLASSVYLA